MTKVCFLLRIDPAQRERYVAAHENVWPDMLAALAASGYQNYSIFLDESGLLVLYFETTDLEASVAAMNAAEVNQRWGVHLEGVFLPVDESRPVGVVAPLPQVFDLEAQLARATHA